MRIDAGPEGCPGSGAGRIEKKHSFPEDRGQLGGGDLAVELPARGEAKVRSLAAAAQTGNVIDRYAQTPFTDEPLQLTNKLGAESAAGRFPLGEATVGADEDLFFHSPTMGPGGESLKSEGKVTGDRLIQRLQFATCFFAHQHTAFTEPVI